MLRPLRYLLLLILSVVPLLFSQPKREFRGAWIATVTNIDWPTTKDSTLAGISAQKQELITLLDSLRSARVNAVVFQVRPSCDAFYISDIEPWSQWLTGKQGRPPADPTYDPLTFAIAEARKRGMEFHAWFNPYRAVRDTAVDTYQAPNHISKTHPEWIFKADRLKMLNPGLPEVRNYVTSVIMDVVRRYDIDAIHFDDYFYPYSGMTNQDTLTWDTYGGGLPWFDWRRENVNSLLRMIRDSILVVKPRTKFGISPFGIWKNDATGLDGSQTNGFQSYYGLYADSRRWVQEGWIDYIAPQIYWDFTHILAPYGILADWWNINSFNRHLYIGQGTYKAYSVTTNWPVKEIISQVEYNRTKGNIHGSIHFSAKYFRAYTFNDITRTLTDSLKKTVYSVPALVPRMAWKDTLAPNPPDSFKVRVHPSLVFLDWQEPAPASDGEIPQQYLVYRSTSLPIDFNNMSNVIYMGAGTSAPDTKPVGTQTFYYAITALDRNQNESPRTTIIGVDANDVLVGTEPAGQIPQSFSLRQNFPNPFNPTTIISFYLPWNARVALRIYDLLGRQVDDLVDVVLGQGEHQIEFHAGALASGVYFYRMTVWDESGGGGVITETRKMQLVR